MALILSSSRNSPVRDSKCRADQAEERGLTSFISGSNLLECLVPAGEPFDGTALLAEFRIEPDAPPRF